ncbi:hypothetical protein JCM11491_000663 [Sporobolomyces phaffii]
MHLRLAPLGLLLPVIASALPSPTWADVDHVPRSLESSLAAGTASSASSSSPATVVDELYRYQNKVYLIRHGEKGPRGETGLNSKGKKRAKCLRKLLATPRFKIGLILAEDYDRKTHKRKRPYDTVKPIADELGLKVDTECEVDDAKCVRRKVEQYAKHGGKGDVLICWKHSMLNTIAHELGAPKTKAYPDDRYDLMWTLHHSRLISKESEHCPGLDPQGRKHDVDVDGELRGFDEDLDEEEDELELDVLFRGDLSSQLRLADLD